MVDFNENSLRRNCYVATNCTNHPSLLQSSQKLQQTSPSFLDNLLPRFVESFWSPRFAFRATRNLNFKWNLISRPKTFQFSLLFHFIFSSSRLPPLNFVSFHRGIVPEIQSRGKIYRYTDILTNF